MEIAMPILAVASLAFFCALCVRYFTHMFQLNSYTAHVQFLWMRENSAKLLPPVALLLAGISCAFLSARDFSYAYGLLALAALLLALFYLPKKAKKPLVYTARVKRLLGTYTVLTVLLTAVALAFGKRACLCLLGIGGALTPLTLVLANLLNAPMEKAIRDHYTREAIEMLRGHKRLKIIGITGSYGKTSVKYYLTSLLRVRYNVLMTPESYNTPMGVVKTIRSSLRSTHNVFVCEMGAKYVGDIQELCDIVHPHDGMITSIGEQHLESFGSVQNIIHTKYELCNALPRDGKCLINISSETVDENRPGREAITYGITDRADYYADNICVSENGTTFTLHHKDEVQEYTTKLLGEANVTNIVGALAMAHEYDIPLADMVGAVRKLPCVPHRMELLDRGGLLLIDDAFNSNPHGAAAALRTVGLFDAVRIIVTPGMIELGEKEEECNAELGKNAAAVCDYIVAVGEKQAKPIVRGAKEAGFDESRMHVAKTFAEAMQFVYGIPAEGKKKVVLLENDLPDNF